MNDEAEIEEIKVSLQLARAEVLLLEKRLLGLMGRKSHLPAEHGTDSGYYAHRRHWGTTPCQPCKDAHATVERLRKMRREGDFNA